MRRHGRQGRSGDAKKNSNILGAPADVKTGVTRARALLDQVLDIVAQEADATITVSAVDDRASVSPEAVQAFVEAAGEILGKRELTVDAARRAGLLAAAGSAWEDALGPQLNSAQVRELLGGVTRQRIDELLRQQRLIGLQATNSRWLFPAFQFVDGRAPAPGLASAFWKLSTDAIDPWSAASWCVSRNDQLKGRTPAAVAAEDGELVARVGERDAERLSR